MLKLTLDPDGYPTDECLESISKCKIQTTLHAIDLLRNIKKIWAYPNFGWKETTDAVSNEIIFNISTAGWSGNESIIAALKENFIFWSFSWEQSRRGGHYIFKVKII